MAFLKMNNNTKRLCSAGVKLVCVVYFIFYIFPFLGNTVFNIKSNFIYKVAPLTFGSFIYMMAVLIVFLIAANFIRVRFYWPKLSKALYLIGLRYFKFRLWVAILSLVVASVAFLEGMVFYRYAYGAISSNHNFPLLVVSICLRNFIFLDMFYQVFCRVSVKSPGKVVSISNVLYSLAALLLANGVVTMFLSLVILLYALLPKFFLGFYSGKNWKYMGLGFLSLAAIFMIAYKGGNVIKVYAKTPYIISEVAGDVEDFFESVFSGLSLHESNQGGYQQGSNQQSSSQQSSSQQGSFQQSGGSQQSNELTANEHSGDHAQVKQHLLNRLFDKISNVARRVMNKLSYVARRTLTIHVWKKGLYYLTSRMSTHYYSYLYAMSSAKPRFNESAKAVPFKSVAYRMKVILHKALFLDHSRVKRPEFASISQLNYRMLIRHDQHVNKREGTSPGILASFIYFLSAPLGFVVIVLYLLFLAGLMNGLLYRNKGFHVSILGLLLVVAFTQVLYQSPIDFLMLFDTGFIQLLGLVLIYLGKQYVLKSDKENEAVTNE